MFESILPHQIILMWIGISGLTGTIVAYMISEGKNPLYILGNIFFCGFIGALFGGFFVALTDALVWDFWSLLIPIFIGGIVSFLVAMFLRDKIPTPTLKIKPIAMVLAIVMILMMSFASAYPLMEKPSRVLNVNGDMPSLVNVGDVSIVRPSGNNYDTVKLADAINSISIKPSELAQLENYPLMPVSIESYHTSIDFPSKLAEDPSEGDYITFKLTFGVSSSSPVDWREPLWTVFCWGDVNGNGEMDEDDTILSEKYFKIPSQSGSGDSIYTSAPCVYDADGNPMWAMYGVQTSDGYMLLPVTFAMWDEDGQYPYNAWKDDSQYTFDNTPEGFKPPYDQSSWQIDSSGTLSVKEKIWSWAKINKGDSYPVYGKLYCPNGMGQYAEDWYVTVIAYDMAYSDSEPIATHDMHFKVSGAGEKPVVNISSDYWVETAMFAIVGIACLAVVKYGGKWAFK